MLRLTITLRTARLYVLAAGNYHEVASWQFPPGNYLFSQAGVFNIRYADVDRIAALLDDAVRITRPAYYLAA